MPRPPTRPHTSVECRSPPPPDPTVDKLGGQRWLCNFNFVTRRSFWTMSGQTEREGEVSLTIQCHLTDFLWGLRGKQMAGYGAAF